MLASSLSFAYVVGGSNLGIFGYPELEDFRGYGSVSKYDVERYVREAEEYIDNCNYDIQRIVEASEEAEYKANFVIKKWNAGHYR